MPSNIQISQEAPVRLVFYNHDHKVPGGVFYPFEKEARSVENGSRSREWLMNRMWERLIGRGKFKKPWTEAVFFKPGHGEDGKLKLKQNQQR